VRCDIALACERNNAVLQYSRVMGDITPASTGWGGGGGALCFSILIFVGNRQTARKIRFILAIFFRQYAAPKISRLVRVMVSQPLVTK
jgi:hypothetical protein